jgi:hypothetical protein
MQQITSNASLKCRDIGKERYEKSSHGNITLTRAIACPLPGSPRAGEIHRVQGIAYATLLQPSRPKSMLIGYTSSAAPSGKAAHLCIAHCVRPIAECDSPARVAGPG